MFLSFFVLCGRSAPVWVSHYSASSNSQDVADNIALASDGSVYVSGFPLVPGPPRAAIVKYSASGQQLWAVENTNIARVEIFEALPLTAVDPGGGVRLAGNWSAATNEVALVSYSSTGTLLWERHYRDGIESHPYAIAVDGSSNTIVVGLSIASAPADALTLKYGPNGTLLWCRTYSLLPASAERAYSVLPLADGAVLVGIGCNSRGAMLLKYDADGQLLWTAELGAQGIPGAIAIDSSGAIVVAAVGYSQGALFKLTANGELIWRQWPIVDARYLALDPSGNIYVSGTFTTKYDASGARQWVSMFAQSDALVYGAAGIAATESGVSVAFTVSNTGTRFTAVHYNTNGIEVWRESYLDAAGEVRDMIGDESGGLYLTGAGGPFITADFQTVKFQPEISPNLPVIVRPPRPLEVIAGTNSVTFSVETGPGQHTFQWRSHGEAIPGATNATLRVTDVRYGSYSVVVSNAYGYVVSPEASLHVLAPPQFEGGWPTDLTAIAGDDLVLYMPVSGDGLITYEWRKDGVLLPFTNSVLIIEPVAATDAGTYTSVARTPYGTATNDPLVVTVLPRTPIDDWRWSRPQPQGDTLRAVAFGNGHFVAVGDAGVMLTSTDGVNWALTNLSRFDLTGVTFGHGLFVAASSTGAIYTSADGLDWTQRARPPGTYPWQLGVSFLNGIFVCYGQELRSSTNGVDWINHGPSPSPRPITYGAGRYLIPAYGHIMMSTNLTDWRPYIIEPLLYEYANAAYGNGVFVINNGSQKLYTSPDGIEVTSLHHAAPLMHVVFVNGRFFAVGETIESSVDGVTWTRAAANPGHPLLSVAHGNGIYVAVGYAGAIATSIDGHTWARTPRRLSTVRDLAYGAGRYVAVGDEEAWTSTDGELWSPVTGPAAEDPAAIEWANGIFVIAGANGELLTSRDGAAWTRIPTATNDLRAVIHDGSRFVVVGEQTTLFSTNGFQWTQIAAPELRSVRAVAFGGGVYVLSRSDFNSLRRSTNAIDWEAVTGGPSPSSLAYGNGTFVGLTSFGASVSPDGVTWTHYQIADGYVFESIVFAGGTFVAGTAPAEGSIATSTDGRDWRMHRPRPQLPRSRIAYANGALWIVGANESIIRSAQIEPAMRARKTAAGLELTIEAYPDRSYRLQRATALGSWTNFRTFTPQSETTTLTDNDTAQSTFYRVLSP